MDSESSSDSFEAAVKSLIFFRHVTVMLVNRIERNVSLSFVQISLVVRVTVFKGLDLIVTGL